MTTSPVSLPDFEDLLRSQMQDRDSDMFPRPAPFHRSSHATGLTIALPDGDLRHDDRLRTDDPLMWVLALAESLNADGQVAELMERIENLEAALASETQVRAREIEALRDVDGADETNQQSDS